MEWFYNKRWLIPVSDPFSKPGKDSESALGRRGVVSGQ